MFHWFRDLLEILRYHKVRHIPGLVRDRFLSKKINLTPRIELLSVNNYASWGINKLKVPAVWSQTKGAGIRVAVLDTGIDANHIDLRDAMSDMIDVTNERDPLDYNGHGTHVAGIIGARNVSGKGMTGVAPGCTILSCKVLNNKGNGNYDWIVAGLNWAIKKRVDVINMSLGCRAPYGPLHKLIVEAYNAGIIVVAAAGNDGHFVAGDNMGYPAKYHETIAVGAISQNMSAAQFSSIGSELDIMAPGGAIFSTFPGNRYATLSGTSQASPFIAGICALILARHRSNPTNKTPIRNTFDMIEHLKKSALDMDRPGWDEKTGFGVINPDKIFTDV